MLTSAVSQLPTEEILQILLGRVPAMGAATLQGHKRRASVAGAARGRRRGHLGAAATDVISPPGPHSAGVLSGAVPTPGLCHPREARWLAGCALLPFENARRAALPSWCSRLGQNPVPRGLCTQPSALHLSCSSCWTSQHGRGPSSMSLRRVSPALNQDASSGQVIVKLFPCVLWFCVGNSIRVSRRLQGEEYELRTVEATDKV